MTPRGTRLAHPIAEVISGWNGVDSITVLQSGSDPYDPYYFLSLDVYCSDDIPGADERQSYLQGHSAFESSLVSPKDRFFVGETPVRLEYKETTRFDELQRVAAAGKPKLRDAGTYPFFRLSESEILFARTDWIKGMRESLQTLPDRFWKALRENQRARAEHTFSDLSAAAYRGDPLFFMVSVGRFIRSLSGLLFTINKEFQPSYRLLTEKLLKLDMLPTSFSARLETFTRQDGSVTMEQRRELAELMVTSTLSL